jgi:hypothetical protein
VALVLMLPNAIGLLFLSSSLTLKPPAVKQQEQEQEQQLLLQHQVSSKTDINLAMGNS